MPEQSTPHSRIPAASPARWGGRMVIALLLGGLLFLSYLVLSGFVVPLLWAAILAYVTWPLNRALRRAFKRRRGLAALAMTLVLTFAIVLPLLGVVASLRVELVDAFDALREDLEAGSSSVPPFLRELPLLGPRLTALADRLAEDPQAVGDWLTQRGSAWIGEAAGLVGSLGRNALKFTLALVAVFFFYRDGERLVNEMRHAMHCLLGRASRAYWTAAASMTQAVVYGLVLTALAQGAIAGFGYWVAGLDAPVLLGTLTALFALVPFGAPVVWVTVSLWLLWQGDLWAAVGLLLWGALAVSSVDNLVRPLVISASAKVSFLLVLFGVLGGLNAFGLVGLFLGPVVLAVSWAVWQHWLVESDAACADTVDADTSGEVRSDT
ncbi:MAG: AI-2E family transporter [Thiohalomonadaceae bacterium]